MYNILVCKDYTIKDYNKDYTMFNNVIIASDHGEVVHIYSDLSGSNCNIYQIEDPIDGFIGNKFLYIDGVISENPDYVELEV